MFFITLLNEFDSPRCVGYQPLEWVALFVIKQHVGNESRYNHLVIEEIDSGIYPDTKKQIWFKWVDGTWKEIEKPIWAKGTTNWAIG